MFDMDALEAVLSEIERNWTKSDCSRCSDSIDFIDEDMYLTKRQEHVHLYCLTRKEADDIFQHGDVQDD